MDRVLQIPANGSSWTIPAQKCKQSKKTKHKKKSNLKLYFQSLRLQMSQSKGNIKKSR